MNSSTEGNKLKKIYEQNYFKLLAKSEEESVLSRNQNEEQQKNLESSERNIQSPKNSISEKELMACKMKNNELQERLNKSGDMLNWYKLQYKSLEEKSVALELENQELKNKIEEGLNTKMKELREMKSTLAKCVNENKSLGKERDDLEDSISKIIEVNNSELKRIREDSEKSKEKYKALKEQYGILRTSNIETKEELAKEIVSRKLLVSELKKRKNEIKKFEEAEKLQNNMSNELIQTIVEIYNDIDELYENCILARDEFVKEIKSHNRSAYSKTLEELKSEYDQYEVDLNNRGVTVSKRKFLKKMREYENLCAENDTKWKDKSKQAYDMPKVIDYVRNKMKTDSSKLFSDVITIMDELKDNLKDLRKTTIRSDFDEEKRKYENAMDIAMKEISYRRNLLRANDEIAANTSAYYTNDEKDWKMLNNGKREELKRWDSTFSIASNCELEANERSIIIFNLPENKSEHEDMDMIKIFLRRYKLNIEDFEVNRMGKVKPEKPRRPTVVEFKDIETLNEILENEKEPRHFNGYRIRVRKFEPRRK